MKAQSDWQGFSEINVTPFVDVMLVLLVIFMVSAPLLDQQGIAVALPRAASGQATPEEDLAVTLTRDHLIYLDKEMLTLDDLRERLTSTPRSTPILIRSDDSAYVKKLVELWDLCRELGFSKIHIATTRE